MAGCRTYKLETDPTPDLGIPCDSAITKDGKFYNKYSNGWDTPFQLVGKPGEKGEKGDKGEKGEPGALSNRDRETIDYAGQPSQICCTFSYPHRTINGSMIKLVVEHSLPHPDDVGGACRQ